MKLNPKITGLVARTGAKLKVNSPTILMVSGIVLGVGAIASIIKQAPKAQKIREEFDAEMSMIEDTFNKVQEAKEQNLPVRVNYTEETKANDIRLAYAHKVWKYVKLYGPSIALEAASIACFIFSHGLMKKRIASLTAACATVTDMFNRYRENVRNEFGDEVDRRMRYGLVAEKVKEQVVDPETGKTKTVTKEVAKAAKDLPWRSDYAKLYQEGCRGWIKDANQNYLTLRSQEAYCNQRLRENGFLFLNDVYELLGIDQTEAGHEVGWIYEKDNAIGDNYVSFHLENSPEFSGGLERNIWLDFNVDGPIRHRIKWAKI